MFQSMKKVTCIEDLRRIHKRRVPKAFFDYVDHGSYAEETMHANRRDMAKLTLRPRAFIDVSSMSVATTLLGEPCAMPMVLAPVGLCGLQHQDGEIQACKAAQAAGIPYTLSTMSICSIEDVAANADRPFWFQLAFMKDRGFMRSLIERAIAAKCSALVLTVDLPVNGQRHADVKNGMTVPPTWTLGKLADFASKPAWIQGVLRGKRRSFGNLMGYPGRSDDITSISAWISSQFDQSMTWKDMDWIRGLWPGKIVVKGIMDEEDARTAVTCGASAIVVSNHGGRQLDGAPSSISVLPKIVDAVGTSTEMMLDGGVRSGQDIMRALALGANACMIGRAYVYGLGAGGEQGVAKAIDLMKKELSVTMALCGVTTVSGIGRHVLLEN